MWHIISMFIIGAVCAQIGAWLERRRAKRKQHAYNWACLKPYCGFKASSDNSFIVQKIAHDHQLSHQERV